MAQPKFIASCSFGKDSLATILLAKEHGELVDEAVYCEVMFDKDASGEVPEHRDFIYDTAIPALERMGIKMEIQIAGNIAAAQGIVLLIQLMKSAFLGLSVEHFTLPILVMLCVTLTCSGIAVKCFKWE